MAIKTVKVKIDGKTHTLAYNGDSGKYETTLTAPTITSYNKPNGYYSVQIEAVDEAGNMVTEDETNTNNRLIVKENVPPEISDLSPSDGARVTSAGPELSGKLTDETNGSGIDTSTFVLKVDGVSVNNADVVLSSISGGYTFAYPSSGLEQGKHTFTVDVKDNDGNTAAQRSIEITVDTIAPKLNISKPEDGFITNNASIDVSGTTSDKTSGPVDLIIEINGVDQGKINIGNNGNFTKTVTLSEGSNDIVIKSTDSSGLSTTINRSVMLDTTDPTITSVELVPNPVDAGATYIIKVSADD